MAGTTPVSPDLQSLLAGSGIDIGSLLSTPQQQPTTQADIAAAMIQAAKDASTSYGSTLPWWAQGLRSSLVSEQQFAPVYKAGEGLVYLDTKSRETTQNLPANKFTTDMGGPAHPVTTGNVSNDYALTVTQASNLPYTWDEGEVADAIKRLKDAGIKVDSFDMGSNSLVTAWQGLVTRAALTYQTTDGKTKLTPWDVLDLYKKEADTTGTDPNRTETYVQRNVTDITEGEAFASLQSNLSQLLGRDPSDQETRDYAYRMNHLAATNPSISKTVTQYKDGTAVGSSTHTDPGFTQADMAQEAYDQAQNDPEYGEYRAASYLFDAVQSALGPIGG